MTAHERIEKYLHQIVDEIHPEFMAVSDEEMIEDHKDYGVFTRDFVHTNGNHFHLEWRVYYGNPETVKTVFNVMRME